jgi:hypothetical protein
MEFRIVKTDMLSKFHEDISGTIPNWDGWYYIVQYKRNPSLWNLWSPKWKNATYNEEEFLCYYCKKSIKFTSSHITYPHTGYLIPGQTNATKLLALWKTRFFEDLPDTSFTVVYEEKEINQSKSTAEKYDNLLRVKK